MVTQQVHSENLIEEVMDSLLMAQVLTKIQIENEQ